MTPDANACNRCGHGLVSHGFDLRGCKDCECVAFAFITVHTKQE